MIKNPVRSLRIYLCLGLQENPRVGLRRHNKEHKREQSDRQGRQHHSYTQLSRTSRQLEAEHYDDLFGSRVELEDSEVYRGARETARAQGAPDILKQVSYKSLHNPPTPPNIFPIRFRFFCSD